MDLNEAQTRAQRIDRQLFEACWGQGAEQIDFEAEFEVDAYGTATQGFVDYLLRGPDDEPIAIVEAKRASRDALAGKEQARLYADAIQKSSGRRPFIFLANGDEIWFWDSGTDARLVAGFATREDLERRLFQREHRASLLGRGIDAQIVDRAYQHLAIRKVQEAVETDANRRALLVMATGTGKTRVATALVETLVSAGWAQRVLFLADRDALAEQALRDGFQSCGVSI